MKHFRLAALQFAWSFSLLAVPVQAATGSNSTYPFQEVWRRVSQHSPELIAADHELKAARIHEARQSRHWYPRIFAEGRAFATNDPAATFISLLGQRQIAGSDFAPATLNQPGRGFFERATLGIDLPLFEGGSKVAMARAAGQAAEASAYGSSSVRRKQYSEIAAAYASVFVLEGQSRELSQLAEGVEETLGRYSIGAKSNPVGYSGLLGLKNLRNRIQGLLVDNGAKQAGLRDRVRVDAVDLPLDWSPVQEELSSFIDKRLPLSEPSGRSAAENAAYAAADAVEQLSGAQRAQFLPRVGLFGTGDLYGGDRSAATSYMAGAYLQWDLLSVPSFGALDQAKHQAAAALARADVESHRVDLARSGARHSEASLQKNLALMDESSKFLQEQSVTTRSLFRNGSITALQLVEVLARRADLLVNRADAQLGLIQARALLFVYSSATEVPHDEE